MKQVAACLLAIFVASNAISVQNEVWQYQAGHQYRYSYRGMTQSGIPMMNNERAGIAIFTDLTLDFKTLEDVTLHLENSVVRNIDFKDANDRLPIDQVPTLEDALKSHIFQKLPTEIEQELLQFLKKPISFVFSKTTGQISDVKSAEEEPEWSLNIKLGVAERFQLQISNSQVGTHATEDALMGKSCGVRYDSVRTSETNKRNITKVLNIDDCEGHAISHDVGGLYHRKSSKDMMRSSQVTRAEVDVSPNEHKRRCFLHSAVTEGRLTCRPVGSNEGELTTFTRQVIEYRGQKKLRTAASTSSLVKRSSSLFRTLASNLVSTSVYDDVLPEAKKVLMVEKLLKKISAIPDAEVGSESTMEYMYAIQLMRSLKKSDSVKVLVENILKDKESARRRPMFIYALLCGNPAFVKILPEIEHLLSTPEMNAIITSFPSTLMPTEESILTLKRMYTSERADSTTRQLLLVIGAQTYSLCGARSPGENHPTDICSTTFKSASIKFFMQAYQTAPENRKVIVLKAIGNSGLDMSEFLGQLIQTSNLQADIRVNAIYSLRRCENADHIIDILMPVFRNEMFVYPVEMRIAAFNILIEKVPEEDMLVSLVSVLNIDNDKQLGNYIYSYVDNLVKLPSFFAHTHNLTISAQTLLPTVRRFEDGIYYSKNMQFVLRKLSQQVAQFIEVNVINTPETILPRSMNLRILTSLNRYYQSMLEVGFRFEGLDTLLKNLIFGEGGLVSNVQSTMSGRWKREIDQLTSILKDPVEPRGLKTSKGYIFFKFLGHELGVLTLDDIASYDFKDALSRSIVAFQGDIDHFTLRPLIHVFVRAQTPMGIPSMGSLRMSAMYSLQATNTEEKQPNSVFSKKITSKFLLKSVGVVGVDMGVFRSCVSLNGDLSIRTPLVTRVTTENGNVAVEMHINTESDIYKSNIAENKKLVQFSLRNSRLVESVNPKSLDYTFRFTPAKTNPLIPNYEVATEYNGLRVAFISNSKDTTIKRPEFPVCGNHEFTVEMTDEVKRWGFKLEVLPKNVPGKQYTLQVITHLNPRIDTLRKELGVTGTVNLEQKHSKPLFMVQVAPKWITDSVYNMMFNWKVLSDKRTPTFNYTTAGEEREELLKFLTIVQLGWNTSFNPKKQDIIIKTTLGKSDLQKMFEIEEIKLEDSDCAKCEHDIAKGLFTTIDCGTCMSKRSWLSKIQSDIFFDSQKVKFHGSLPATLEYILYPYYNTPESEHDSEDVERRLIDNETNLIDAYMTHNTKNHLTALRNTFDIHPYFSEFNATIWRNENKVVFSRVPLVPAHRKLYHLPLFRLADTAVKRIELRRPMCILDSTNTVMTMDGVRYTLPKDTQCEQVLLSECKKDNSLEITTRLTYDNRRAVVIKMAIESSIEIVQLKKAEEYAIKVNKMTKQWQPTMGNTQVREIVTGSMRAIMQPIQTPHGLDFTVSVNILPARLSLTMANNLVNIDAPMRYKNHICGLCGDFNGEMTNEWILPNQTRAPTLDAFIRAYSGPNCIRRA